MGNRLVTIVGLLLASASPALAQKMELTGLANWVFSDGVTAAGVATAPDGNSYNQVDPGDSASFGLSAGFLVNPNAEVGFIFSAQPTALFFNGPSVERNAGDLTTTTYHGYYGYTIGDGDARVRPYVLVGVGATTFGAVESSINGVPHTFESQTKFSTTIGGGVKYYASPRVGVRAGLRWTPARIPADSAGWWCDDQYSCFVVGGTKYATQVEMGGGVFVRF